MNVLTIIIITTIIITIIPHHNFTKITFGNSHDWLLKTTSLNDILESIHNLF